MESTNEFIDASLNSKKNFEDLEKKIQSVISECNESNKETIIEVEDAYFARSNVEVENAAEIEEYKLNDGLYVYRYLNKLGEPINYRISENVLIDIFGTLKEGVPCIEYSKGGAGNGAMLDQTCIEGRSISFCFNERSKSTCIFRANGEGFGLEKAHTLSKGLYKFYDSCFFGNSSPKAGRCMKNGDLLGLIGIFDYDNKLGIKSVFDKVEKRTLVKKEGNSSRKNYLKLLLRYLFNKNASIEVWNNSSSKGNRR